MLENDILTIILLAATGAIAILLLHWFLSRNKELIQAGKAKKKKQQIFEPAILLARGADRIWTFTKSRYSVEDGKVENDKNQQVDLPNNYIPERIMPKGKPGRIAWLILTVKGMPVEINDKTAANNPELHPIMNPTHTQNKNEKKSFNILTHPRSTLDNKTIMMLLIGAVFGIFIGIVAAPYLPTAHQQAPTIITLFPNGTIIPMN